MASLPVPPARRRALAARRRDAVRDGGLGHPAARRGHRAAADAARPGRVGRHLVPLDRRPRLRPVDRARRQRRLPAALPAAAPRAAGDRPVRRPGVARRSALDRADGGRHVPALQAHGRALRPHDRAAHGALHVDLAARVRVLGGLRREPLPRARVGRVPARRAPALPRRLGARGARRADPAGRARARAGADLDGLGGARGTLAPDRADRAPAGRAGRLHALPVVGDGRPLRPDARAGARLGSQPRAAAR